MSCDYGETTASVVEIDTSVWSSTFKDVFKQTVWELLHLQLPATLVTNFDFDLELES